MNLTREQHADGLRDVLALMTAVLDQDADAVNVIVAAQDDNCRGLAFTAVATLIGVLAACGHDVRAWVAEVRERAETR